MILDIDEILIAVFLTVSIVLIVAWYVAILKWKKVYLQKIIPCIKIKTKKTIQKAPHESDEFKYPVIKTISNSTNFYDNPHFVDIDLTEPTNSIKYQKTLPNVNYTYKIDANNNMIIESFNEAKQEDKPVNIFANQLHDSDEFLRI